MSNLDPKSSPGSSERSSDSAPQRLPFEPKKNKKKTPAAGSEQKAAPSTAPKSASPKSGAQKSPKNSAPKNTSPKTTPQRNPAVSEERRSANKYSKRATLEQTRIPDQVSRRMISRIMLFSGVPSLLGVSTFFASYLIVTQELFELPNVAVVLVSMGCFGLGVLGLSYGVLSSSWEESEPGTALGWQEFRVNTGRFLSSWREFRQQSRGK